MAVGPWDAWILGGCALLAAVVTGTATYLVGPTRDETSKELSNSPTITLEKPEGPKIPEKNRLEGTVSALRGGEMVWAFTASAEDRTQIYPLFGPCPVKDGEWACPYSFIGEEEGEPVDKKSKHVIWVAVITDLQAASAVQALGKQSERYIEESAAQEPPHVDDAIESKIFLRR